MPACSRLVLICVGGPREPRRRCYSAFHLDVGRQLRRRLQGLLIRQFLKFNVTALQNRDDSRIKTFSRILGHLGHGLFQRQSLPVLAVRGQSIEAIDCSQNASPNRNVLSGQSVRISATVPFFVMGAHDRHHWIRKVDLLQNLRADRGMDFHLVEFFRRQFAGLRNNVLWHRQLSDIVQDRCRAQCFRFVLAQTQFLREFHGVHPHPLQVFAGGFVFGFNGQRESFNCSQVQARDLLCVALLGLQFAEIKTIGSVHEIDRRQNQQRRLPPDMPVQEMHEPGHSGSHHVVGE